jgi:D-glycero-alpha-D-manno-heptose 1-phosphate guanylyltransferase
MKPVVILAGGLGTRLRETLPDLPKPLAPVAGRPFLWWLLKYLEKQGARDVYISIGYKGELIRREFGYEFGKINLQYVEEYEQLGTGGAVKLAAEQLRGEDFFVLNGDTIAITNLTEMEASFKKRSADIAMAVTYVQDATRFGTVRIAPDLTVRHFDVKGSQNEGYINAGIYLIKKTCALNNSLPKSFSLERDLIAKNLKDMRIFAFNHVEKFIDIGVPEAYAYAQTFIPKVMG